MIRNKSGSPAKRVVGIMGLIGSGKSSVSKIISGIHKVINADDVSADILENNKTLQTLISHRFGIPIRDGMIDKKALGDIVFSNKDALLWLDQTMHPLIYEEISQSIESAQSPVFVELSVYVPKFMELLTDLIFVQADPADIFARVEKRSGWSRQKTAQVIEIQLPQMEKLYEFPGLIKLDNKKGLEDLEEQVLRVIKTF